MTHSPASGFGAKAEEGAECMELMESLLDALPLEGDIGEGEWILTLSIEPLDDCLGRECLGEIDTIF